MQNSLAGIGMVLEKVKGKDVESMPVGKELAGSWQGAWLGLLYWSALPITARSQGR